MKLPEPETCVAITPDEFRSPKRSIEPLVELFVLLTAKEQYMLYATVDIHVIGVFALYSTYNKYQTLQKLVEPLRLE